MITYAQKTPLNTHTDISSLTRGLFLSLSLHLQPYFVYASKEDSTGHEPSLINVSGQCNITKIVYAGSIINEP